MFYVLWCCARWVKARCKEVWRWGCRIAQWLDDPYHLIYVTLCFGALFAGIFVGAVIISLW